MREKMTLFIALLFPIILLIALTVHKKHILETGYEIMLPISGYDPRAFLAGHYITYIIDYQVPTLCHDYRNHEHGYVCIDKKTFSPQVDPDCLHYIRGICKNGRFEAGIERFYIPEKRAKELDSLVREHQASIVISVMPDGQAQVKDLKRSR